MTNTTLYSKAMSKNNGPTVESGAKQAPRKRPRASRILWGFFLVIVLLAIGYFAFQLVVQLQAKDAQLSRSQEAISRIEKTLESLSREMTMSSREMVALRTDLQEALKSAKGTGADIAELEKQIDVQNFNIANLVKAKDNLFGRVSTLSEKVEKINTLFAPEG